MIGSEKKNCCCNAFALQQLFAYSAAGMERNAYEKLYNTDGSSEKTDCEQKNWRSMDTKEHMTTEELMPLVAEGKVVICANKNHTCIDPEGIGSMLRTKINVNLGVSRDCKDYDVEMQKVMQAVEMGAHAIMDLSSHGNYNSIRRKLTK